MAGQTSLCVMCRHPYKSPQHGLCVIQTAHKGQARQAAELQRHDLRAAKHYRCAPAKRQAFCADCGTVTSGDALCPKCNERRSDKVYRQCLRQGA